MYKKAWCTYKVVVLLNKPIALFSFSLLLPLSLLKLPSDDGDGNDDDDDEEEEEEDSIILMCKILKSYWSNRYTLPLV